LRHARLICEWRQDECFQLKRREARANLRGGRCPCQAKCRKIVTHSAGFRLETSYGNRPHPTVGVLVMARSLGAAFNDWRGAAVGLCRAAHDAIAVSQLLVRDRSDLVIMHLLNLVGMPTGQNQPR